MLEHFARHQKLLIDRPAVILFGQFDFFVSQWRTVSAGGVLFVGCSPTDDAFQDDQRRLVGAIFERLIGRIDRFDIVRIFHGHDVPAEPLETSFHIFAKRKFGTTFDRDFVVVVNPAKV